MQRTPFHHLRKKDRDRIESLLDAGVKQNEIAKILKVHPATIAREKKHRKRNGRYDADVAEQKAQVKRSRAKYKGMKIEANDALREYIIKGLRQKRSPDELAGRMKRDREPFYASHEAIYAWLYSVYGQAYTKYLCTKRWRKRPQKKKTKREMIPNRIGIAQRPLGATNKTRYGHFEGDTIVAPKRAKNTEAIAIIVERKTKLLLATKIPSLSPKHMTKAVNTMARKKAMLSITLDNGIENKNHEDWQVRRFFADAHAPWQKPLVESSIGLARRWYFPKGTNWKMVSEQKLQNVFLFLNHKHRKSLGYQSAIEADAAHGMIIKRKKSTRGT